MKILRDNNEKTFKIFSVGLTLIISNILASHGISKIDLFVDDLSQNLKRTFKIIKDNASYMQFDKGKKISEGKFN